jgi:hypothetical protein
MDVHEIFVILCSSVGSNERWAKKMVKGSGSVKGIKVNISKWLCLRIGNIFCIGSLFGR